MLMPTMLLLIGMLTLMPATGRAGGSIGHFNGSVFGTIARARSARKLPMPDGDTKPMPVAPGATAVGSSGTLMALVAGDMQLSDTLVDEEPDEIDDPDVPDADTDDDTDAAFALVELAADATDDDSDDDGDGDGSAETVSGMADDEAGRAALGVVGAGGTHVPPVADGSGVSDTADDCAAAADDDDAESDDEVATTASDGAEADTKGVRVAAETEAGPVRLLASDTTPLLPSGGSLFTRIVSNASERCAESSGAVPSACLGTSESMRSVRVSGISTVSARNRARFATGIPSTVGVRADGDGRGDASAVGSDGGEESDDVDDDDSDDDAEEPSPSADARAMAESDADTCCITYDGPLPATAPGNITGTSLTKPN